MAEQKKISPLVKTGLELGPVLAFFVAYLMLKDRHFTIGGTEYEGFIVVTAGFIPLMLVCTGILWKLTGHLSRMQVVTAVMVVIFGGLSIWLNDPAFLKLKVTLIYLLFGGALGIGLLRGESWLQLVMEEALPLDREGWMKLTRRLTAFFLALAVLNQLIATFLSEETWVYFKTFGVTAALFLFFMAQGKLMRDHGTEPEKGAD